MEEAQNFILSFLEKEAECWTKSELNNLNSFNQSIKEFYSMGTNDMDEAFGIFEEDELEPEDNPKSHRPGYLFKISEYQNPDFETIWVGYTSYKNPYGAANNNGISRAFIFTQIKGALKVLGMMSVALNDADLSPVGWAKSIYNPSNLNIHNLGCFISTERYHEPFDDGFSQQDYLEDK